MSYYNDNDYENSPSGFLNRIPVVTRNILLINIIMYIATAINENFMVQTFAMFFPKSPYFHYWQIITHMFMHGGFMHIFFNMYTLLIFGMVLERTIGPKKFLLFYMVTGLGAAALHTGVEYLQTLNEVPVLYERLLYTPTLGASGAVYGVLLGYAMLYPNNVLTLIFPPISLKAKWMVLIFALIELATGIFGTADGIAHFAHLGGMFFGWLLIFYWRKTGKLFRY